MPKAKKVSICGRGAGATGVAGAGKVKKMSKTARFRDRMEHGCALYQRAILYYPCPQAVMLVEEDGRDKCDHVECYRMALDKHTNFLDNNGYCINALVNRRKMHIVLLIWQHLQATSHADDDYFPSPLVRFSVRMWSALGRNVFSFGPQNMRILRAACAHGMLRPAIDADLYESNYHYEGVKLRNMPMSMLQRAVDERNISAIHLLADLLPPTAWPHENAQDSE